MCDQINRYHKKTLKARKPSILPSLVRVPSTPFMLLPFLVKFVLYLSLHCEKNENKQKEAGFGPFKNIDIEVKLL